MKHKTYLSLIIVIVLAFFALNSVEPKYINQGLSFVNSKTFLSLPQFPEKPFRLGLDLQGGTHLVYEADLQNIERKGRGEKMERLKDILEKRVQGRGSYGLGVSEPIIITQKVKEHHRLIVELPGIKDVNEAIKLIGKTPYLEFKEELSRGERERIIKEKLGEKAEEIVVDAACKSREFLIQFMNVYNQDPCYKPTGLTGGYLKEARLEFNQTTFESQVSLEFNKEGGEIFENFTSKNINKILAIYIDSRPISLPVVREKISGGNAQITGNFTIEEARELAGNLDMGALPVPITLISQNTIGPTLGKISLEKSLKAGMIGFLLVLLFMIAFYRVSGVLASLSLLVYAGILLALFKLVPVTLTLAGIGGAILSVGMAVDANVLIFERMKEERKQGASFSRSVEIGFSRAWPSIRDGNLTTLIVALIMFSFGTSFVKGFAVTLSFGILISMFSALFVVRTFLRSFVGRRIEKIKWLWG